jgi:hypothetical protein
MKLFLALLLTTATAASAQTPAACPALAEQLSELLASAKQRIGRDGQVRVEYAVDAQGRAQLLTLDGERIYRTPVRIAMQDLQCSAGTPQRYVLNIRFADPSPAATPNFYAKR